MTSTCIGLTDAARWTGPAIAYAYGGTQAVIGLDANVLVRYIVQDDPEQTDAAGRLIEGRCTEGSPGYVSVLVLVELVWVLTTAYRYPGRSVATVVLQLLRTSGFSIEDRDAVWAVLREFETGNADFADYLIGHRNRSAGCTSTHTFDRRASQARHFTPVI